MEWRFSAENSILRKTACQTLCHLVKCAALHAAHTDTHTPLNEGIRVHHQLHFRRLILLPCCALKLACNVRQRQQRNKLHVLLLHLIAQSAWYVRSSMVGDHWSHARTHFGTSIHENVIDIIHRSRYYRSAADQMAASHFRRPFGCAHRPDALDDQNKTVASQVCVYYRLSSHHALRNESNQIALINAVQSLGRRTRGKPFSAINQSQQTW